MKPAIASENISGNLFEPSPLQHPNPHPRRPNPEQPPPPNNNRDNNQDNNPPENPRPPKHQDLDPARHFNALNIPTPIKPVLSPQHLKLAPNQPPLQIIHIQPHQTHTNLQAKPPPKHPPLRRNQQRDRHQPINPLRHLFQNHRELIGEAQISRKKTFPGVT